MSLDDAKLVEARIVAWSRLTKEERTRAIELDGGDGDLYFIKTTIVKIEGDPVGWLQKRARK